MGIGPILETYVCKITDVSLSKESLSPVYMNLHGCTGK